MGRYRLKPLALVLISTLLLNACSQLQPKPFTSDEQRQRIIADQASMYQAGWTSAPTAC